MRKLVSFFRSVFVTTFRVWKYYTLKEFFDKGGYIYTPIPGESGKEKPCYYKYKNFDTFITDYPDMRWLVGAKTEYILDGEQARFEGVPEPGFVVHEKKPAPYYPNIALAILCVGLLILLVTLFCISTVVGFLYVGTLTSAVGYILYCSSYKQPIIKQ